MHVFICLSVSMQGFLIELKMRDKDPEGQFKTFLLRDGHLVSAQLPHTNKKTQKCWYVRCMILSEEITGIIGKKRFIDIHVVL